MFLKKASSTLMYIYVIQLQICKKNIFNINIYDMWVHRGHIGIIWGSSGLIWSSKGVIWGHIGVIWRS